jgi:hypothetical protein
MVAGAIVRNISAEATTPTGNIFAEAMRGSVSLSWVWSSSNGQCGNQFVPENMPGGGFIYNGAGISVCSLTATSSSPGSWTVAGASAPEIDPATAGSALTLLAGFAAMMRGRRRAAA